MVGIILSIVKFISSLIILLTNLSVTLTLYFVKALSFPTNDKFEGVLMAWPFSVTDIVKFERLISFITILVSLFDDFPEKGIG